MQERLLHSLFPTHTLLFEKLHPGFASSMLLDKIFAESLHHLIFFLLVICHLLLRPSIQEISLVRSNWPDVSTLWQYWNGFVPTRSYRSRGNAGFKFCISRSSTTTNRRGDIRSGSFGDGPLS